MHTVASDPLLDGLTEDQRQAVMHDDGPLLIYAGPGAGKTTVLTRRIARLIRDGLAYPSEVMAITFARAAAYEMRVRLADLIEPEQARAVTVGTFHSVCARMLRGHAENFGRRGNYTILDQTEQEKVASKVLDAGGEPIDALIADAASVEAKSALRHISAARNRGLDRVAGDGALCRLIQAIWAAYEAELREANCFDFDDLLTCATALLERLPGVRGFYRDRYRYVLVDEYQDTNPIQHRLLAALCAPDRNLTVVGDDDQCVVAGTQIAMADGTTTPVERVRAGEHVRSATGAGTFGPARVIRTHRARRARKGVRVTLDDGRAVTTTVEHTHFAGYGARGLAGRTVTYLMRKEGVGWRVGTAAGRYTIKGSPRLGIAGRCVTEGADAAWIVAVHNDDAHARAHEAILAARYGLPTLAFVSPRGPGRLFGVPSANQALLDQVHGALDTEAGAHALLSEHGLSARHAHHLAQGHTADGILRRKILVTLCARRVERGVSHQVALGGSDAEGREALERAGLPVREGRTPGSWRIDIRRAELAEVLDIAHHIQQVVGGTIQQRAALIGSTDPLHIGSALPLTPAGCVRPGMVMLTENGTAAKVAGVERLTLERPVYDLDVGRTHNYIADGIVTHNSIYSFRQAEVEHLLRFGETYPEHRTVMLVENFRSHGEILDVAHRAVAHNTVRTAKRPVARKGPGGQVHAMRFGADRDEVAWVCDRVQGALAYGVAPPDIRALYPTLREGKVLQRELTARNIKHRMVGSLGIYERPEVGHALAYVKVASNACDPVAFQRAASNPSRYLGEKGMAELLRHARIHTGGDLVAAGLQIDAVQGIDPRARQPIQELCEAVEQARNEAYETRSYAHTAKELIEMPSGIREMLEARRDGDADGEQRHRAAQALEDLDSMVEAFIAYERRDPDDASFAGFLGEVAMDLTEEDPDIDRKRITISTYHRSKGVEADLVICTGCEEGLLPHWRAVEHGDLGALEEQRRLFYVGATRARRWLVFTHAGARHGKPTGGRSRFLAEAGV